MATGARERAKARPQWPLVCVSALALATVGGLLYAHSVVDGAHAPGQIVDSSGSVGRNVCAHHGYGGARGGEGRETHGLGL